MFHLLPAFAVILVPMSTRVLVGVALSAAAGAAAGTAVAQALADKLRR